MDLHPPDTARRSVGLAATLADHEDRTAVVSGDQVISYRDLAERVSAAGTRLGPGRKLVLVAGSNQLEPLVTYLAALAFGHPVMLVPGDHPGHIDSLIAGYDPDVVASAEHGWELSPRREWSAHDLHPDLALLLCTSGSTGSAKMVRLSHRNVQSNAESIAAYLEIDPSDRAATSLPMHYCYGLSVINSHLLAGAGLILTENSVVDPCFWHAFRRHGGTTLAGVPYTFDLLDRIGFASMSVPGLRTVTQAGGRLDPERVRRYAELGEERGWRLFVMYGQTEATARMAYLPPHLAASRPTSIGIPVPGGSFEIRPLADGGTAEEGELLYRGPNVMLGYAERPADLALGTTIDVLHTGDIARRTDDGLYCVTGRTSRFLKLYGLRVDLDRVEQALRSDGLSAVCTGDDAHLIVGIEDDAHHDRVLRLVRHHVGLPPSSVVVVPFPSIPRLPNGKPDYPAITRAAEATASPGGERPDAVTTGRRRQEPVHAVFADVLHRSDVDGRSTFVALGGDSLSYVEMSIRLEETLGHLPVDWHTTPIDELVPASGRRRLGAQVETNVLLRAVAILMVVATHTDITTLTGGAHLLLGLAGFNFARFQLSSGQITRSMARIAVPSMCWIAAMALTSDGYSLAHVFLVHGQFGPGGPDTRWRYWFIESLVQVLAVLAVAFSFPAVRRAELRRPFTFAVAVLAGALAIRFDLIALPSLDHRTFRPHEIFFVFALGWVTARARSSAQLLLVSALIVGSLAGFFDDPAREAFVAVGLLVLAWVPSVRAPQPVVRLAGTVAGASLYIYLTHWAVFPTLLDHVSAWVATAACVAVGVATWSAVQRVTPRVERQLHHAWDHRS